MSRGPPTAAFSARSLTAQWQHAGFAGDGGRSIAGFWSKNPSGRSTKPTGDTGIYLVHQNRRTAVTTLLDTTVAGTAVDPEAPSGSLVSAVGLEREGFRGRWLALNVSMLDAATAESFAGVYLAYVAPTLGR